MPILATTQHTGTLERYERALEWFLEAFTVTEDGAVTDTAPFEHRFETWTQNVFGAASPNRTWIGRILAGESRIERTPETIEGIRWREHAD